MKKPLIRWSLVVILALLAVIGGPIIINECYKGDSGYSFCRTLLDKTDGVTLDSLNEDIDAANRELACAYEKTYKSLLQLKGQTFEAIDVEMQKRANSLLYF